MIYLRTTKGDIPITTKLYDSTGSNKNGSMTQEAITKELNGKAPSNHTHTKSQITDFPASMPASDVYSWAKAATKPSYSWSEITGKPSTFTPASHPHHDADILDVSASKITGVIGIEHIPQGALDRLKIVTTDTQRFALTTSDVQLGDTVKVSDTGRMYYVVDESKLSSEAGYEVYTAGTATSVPWSGITGKPDMFTPSAHKHTTSDITNFPTSMRNPSSMTIRLNGGTTEGTNQFTYDGSAAKTINITASGIGAAASSHNHDDRYYTESEIDTKLANISAGIPTSISWNDVTGKPSTFAPSTHSHTISDVTDLQTTLNGKAPSVHNHSVSQITDFPASLKNPNSMVIQLNSGSSEGQTKFTYDGSAAKTINITPSAIGAAAASHTHNYLPLSGGYLTGDTYGPTVGVCNSSKYVYGYMTIVSINSNNYGALVLGNGAHGTTRLIPNTSNDNGLDVYLPKNAGTLALQTEIPSTLKNPNALTIKLNGDSGETYDGSSAKTVNITPSGINAYEQKTGVQIDTNIVTIENTQYTGTDMSLPSNTSTDYTVHLGNASRAFKIKDSNESTGLRVDSTATYVYNKLYAWNSDSDGVIAWFKHTDSTAKYPSYGLQLSVVHTGEYAYKFTFYCPTAENTLSQSGEEILVLCHKPATEWFNNSVHNYAYLKTPLAMSWGIYDSTGKCGIHPSSTAIQPDGVNRSSITLGDSIRKWASVYATNGTIQTSNELKKNIIKNGIDERYEQLYEKLEPIAFTWNNDTADGDHHDRVHLGLGAQTTKKHMDEVGITAQEYALYCEDPVLDEDGNVTDEKEYGLNYGQLHALHIHMLHKLEKESNEKLVEVKSEIQNSNTDHTNNMKKMSNELEEVKNKNTELQQTIDKLQEQNTELADRCREAEIKIDTLTRRLDAMKEKMDEVEMLCYSALQVGQI